MKKRYINVFYAIGLASVITFIACKKSLEIAPVGATTQLNMATKSGINGLLIGAYRGLIMDGSIWCNCSNQSYSLLGTNELAWGFSGLPYLSMFEQHVIGPTNSFLIDDRWRVCYDGIQRANSILRLLPKVAANQLTETEATQIKAEAIFIRGILHFDFSKRPTRV